MRHERQPLVGVIEMVAVVHNVRGDPAGSKDAETLRQEALKLLRAVVFEGSARVADVEGGGLQRQRPGIRRMDHRAANLAHRLLGPRDPSHSIDELAPLLRNGIGGNRGRQDAVDGAGEIPVQNVPLGVGDGPAFPG